jgi:hypothetical protein
VDSEDDNDDDDSSVEGEDQDSVERMPEIPLDHATIHTSARPDVSRAPENVGSSTSASPSPNVRSRRISETETEKWAEEMRALHAETSLMSSRCSNTPLKVPIVGSADSDPSGADLRKLHARSVADGRQKQSQEMSSKRIVIDGAPPSDSGVTPPQADFLGKGKLVVITGTEMNGCRGRIVGYDDGDR